MIKKYGIVTITKNDIVIQNFTFDKVDYDTVELEVLYDLLRRIEDEIYYTEKEIEKLKGPFRNVSLKDNSVYCRQKDGLDE